MKSLLRSRKAVNRLLECICEWAERDVQVARALAENPEAIDKLRKAIGRGLEKKEMKRGKFRSRKRTPARPLLMIRNNIVKR
ncbi:hypothetical protein [Paenibacillus alkalitolerans]|uniref:hypothetical protein n=1 Tax=Paenibacillus alkalitolerans TaxID=2799335 RepID=UPI0018F5C762|nr:hypothetical protein [Paenibacillus alkalitolerans]